MQSCCQGKKTSSDLSGPSSTIINAALKCVCYVQTPGRDICKYFVLMVMIVLTVMIMEKNK